MGKRNAILQRMGASRRDERLRDRQLDRVENPPPSKEQIRQWAALEEAQRKVLEEQRQAQIEKQKQAYYQVFEWRSEPIRFEPPTPPRRKPEPTVTIGAKRAYFED